MAVTVSILDSATPALKKILLQAEGEPFHKHIAMHAAREVKAGLQARSRKGNKEGWPPTGFFGEAAQATTWTADDKEGAVHISKEGVSTHFVPPFVIRPVNAGALTIPATAEAYGKRARDFSDLAIRLIKTDAGLKPVLMQMESVSVRGKVTKEQRAAIRAEARKLGKATSAEYKKKVRTETLKAKAVHKTGGTIFYWLVSAVRTHPDPDMMTMMDGLKIKATEWVEAWWKERVNSLSAKQAPKIS